MRDPSRDVVFALEVDFLRPPRLSGRPRAQSAPECLTLREADGELEPTPSTTVPTLSSLGEGLLNSLPPLMARSTRLTSFSVTSTSSATWASIASNPRINARASARLRLPGWSSSLACRYCSSMSTSTSAGGRCRSGVPVSAGAQRASPRRCRQEVSEEIEACPYMRVEQPLLQVFRSSAVRRREGRRPSVVGRIDSPTDVDARSRVVRTCRSRWSAPWSCLGREPSSLRVRLSVTSRTRVLEMKKDALSRGRRRRSR